MKNLSKDAIEQMIKLSRGSLKDVGYTLVNGLNTRIVDEITKVSEKVKTTKVKKNDSLTKPISFLDECLEQRLVKMNIPGILDLYERTRGLVDIVFSPAIKLEESTIRKTGKKHIVTLSTELDTEQQAMLIHQMGHIIVGTNKQQVDAYEYKEVMPMLLSHLFYMGLCNNNRYTEESIRRTFLSVKEKTQQLLKEQARFERFPEATDAQIESMMENILSTNVYLSSFEFLLGLTERMEDNSKEVLSYVSSVIEGERTTIEMAKKFDIDTTGFKAVQKQLGVYKATK